MSIKSMADGNVINNVLGIPATHSSVESTDAYMPEVGAYCIACNVGAEDGYYNAVIISYLLSDTLTGLRALAIRQAKGVEGYGRRKRGVFRKVFPGQSTVSTREGFTGRTDAGWDRSAADLSRDIADPLRRTVTGITGLHVGVDDAGVSVSGFVQRPDNVVVPPVFLPDGTNHYVVTLAGVSPLTRYTHGATNALPLVERTTKTQEFSLDHPIPLEIVGTPFLDYMLGSTKPFWVTGSHGDDYTNNQSVDHPTDDSIIPVGPATKDGKIPDRLGYIHESSLGNVVGSNQFDTTTYGYLLKTTLFPYTREGRFGTNVVSGFTPVVHSPNEVESLLAASAYYSRFNYEYNTTRLAVSKEGLVEFEIGATIPKENIPINDTQYEHPHGAGVSLAGHLVGSARLVIGKNRDQEESLDLTTIGQVVLRLGSDDCSLPTTRRDVQTQIRSKNDFVDERVLQYWSKSALTPGDSGSNPLQKVGGESVSLRSALDGGLVIRVGARDPNALRRHFINGYADPQGLRQWGINDAGRIDSRSGGRPTYPAGDNNYSFHNLANVGGDGPGFVPYKYSGSPIPTSMDRHGLSGDLHLVRDLLLRIGANPDSGQSLLLDLGGGMVLGIGKDKKGRSITASLDGGAEIVINKNDKGDALQLDIKGNVVQAVDGNYTIAATGDIILAANRSVLIQSQTGPVVIKAMKVLVKSLTGIIQEAIEFVSNQGGYNKG